MTAPALEARFALEVGDRSARFRVEAEFALERGVLVFFGPTGAGKSLAIQALAGLVRPVEGRIAVGGEALFDAAAHRWVPAHRRRVGYVPQHHALFPFLDVEGNVAFGLPRRERRRGSARVRALLEELGLAPLARARPSSLSGGERQKVALARALVVEPGSTGLELYPVRDGVVLDERRLTAAAAALDAALERLSWAPPESPRDDLPWLASWIHDRRRTGAYLITGADDATTALSGRVRDALHIDAGAGSAPPQDVVP